MEQTFMTIHNLSPNANILFASDSILDILGYYPGEVQDTSCFDYFHPDEVPFARSVHRRGVQLDKAAVLHYARIRSRSGQWISCECCFTIVHDVLVACTSIYRRGEKSQRRALEAPQIRRIFSCSPRDPRYHMLEHLSPKFRMPPMEREPRAALILNRFTRTLTIMFATNAVSSILGVETHQLKGKSFYECIQENCLPAAIRCLESAKANDSIAYLRFWYRDPRREEDLEETDGAYEGGEHEDDEPGEDRLPNGPCSGESTDTEDGGAYLYSHMDVDSDHAAPIIKVENDDTGVLRTTGPRQLHSPPCLSHSSGPQSIPRSTASPNTQSFSDRGRRHRVEPSSSFELEAVVSCTSDGLVVVLRKARPPIPAAHPPLIRAPRFENGVFAAPWAQQPVQAPEPQVHSLYAFAPPLLPQHMPLQDSVKVAGGPPSEQLMRSIRDVAVFAWALIGINGNLATYSRGHPRGEAQPPDGLPVWDPNAGSQPYLGPENQAVRRWADQDSHDPSAAASSQFSHRSGNPVQQQSTRQFDHNHQVHLAPANVPWYSYGHGMPRHINGHAGNSRPPQGMGSQQDATPHAGEIYQSAIHGHQQFWGEPSSGFPVQPDQQSDGFHGDARDPTQKHGRPWQ